MTSSYSVSRLVFDHKDMQHPGDSPNCYGYQTMRTHENSMVGIMLGKSEDRGDARQSNCIIPLTYSYTHTTWAHQNFLLLKSPQRDGKIQCTINIYLALTLLVR